MVLSSEKMLTLIFGFSVGFLLHPMLPPLPKVLHRCLGEALPKLSWLVEDFFFFFGGGGHFRSVKIQCSFFYIKRFPKIHLGRASLDYSGDSWFACAMSHIDQVSEYSGYNKMADLLNVKDSSAEPRILCWVLTSPGGDLMWNYNCCLLFDGIEWMSQKEARFVALVITLFQLITRGGPYMFMKLADPSVKQRCQLFCL